MIELHAQCYYPSYSNYESSDYPPNKFVKCLKGAPVNGYTNVTDVDGFSREISGANRNTAFYVFAKWALRQLQAIGIPNISLVPIPSSSHVDPAAMFTARKLCDAINGFPGIEYEVIPCLTQKEAVQGSSKGGSRKFVDIRDNLVCHADLQGKTVALVDDVVTSGNHLKASATILRNHGAIVGHAISAARTIWERPPNMWAVPIENIDWDANEGCFEF